MQALEIPAEIAQAIATMQRQRKPRARPAPAVSSAPAVPKPVPAVPDSLEAVYSALDTLNIATAQGFYWPSPGGNAYWVEAINRPSKPCPGLVRVPVPGGDRWFRFSLDPLKFHVEPEPVTQVNPAPRLAPTAKRKNDPVGPRLDLFPEDRPSTAQAAPESPAIDYRYITKPEELEKALEPFWAAKVIALDTETTGLDPHLHQIRLLQLAVEDQPVLVLDLFSIKRPGDRQPLARLLQGPAVKVIQNAKFDWKFLKAAGLEPALPLFDTYGASELLEAGNTCAHRLDALAARHLDILIPKEEQRSDWGQATLTADQLLYAARDAWILLPLRKALRPALIEAGLATVARIEFEAVPAIADMELAGMLLDLDYWQQIVADMKASLSEAKPKALGLLPSPPTDQITLFAAELNLDSPAQVLAAFHGLGIDIPNTRAATLAERAADHPAIAALLEYRTWQKAITSFGDTLPKHVHPVTGRIHPDYKQFGSAAGRFSCSSPNLQQVPRGVDVRRAFRPAPGHVYVIADYSQMEIRLAAEISGDQTIAQAYKAKTDLHALTAALTNGIAVEAVTKSQRQAAKALNFGLLYGMGWQKLRSTALTSYGVEFSEAEAQSARKAFFTSYAGLAAWHDRTKRLANHGEISETRTLAGRRRRLPQGSFTQALNSPVQGTGADITKAALGLLYKELQGRGRIVACVHDEIICECPTEEGPWVKELLERCMVEAALPFVKSLPVEAEAAIAATWADK
jgi:DNA polymerase-1